MANNSDYNKARINLLQFLPEVFQSSTNRSLFENVFNRYFSKTEVHRVAGFIGQGNSSALIDTQLLEATLHRQAFQLQPLLYEKIGSVEHISSWADLRNELERIGIDIDEFARWGSVLQFNWVPPIDIDKILHFRDYYWYDPLNSSSTPQYITVRNRCTTAEADVRFWDNLIDLYGATIQIDGVNSSTNQLILNSVDYSKLFAPGFVFFIKNSTNPDLNNTFFTTDSSFFDTNLGTNGQTVVTLTTDFTDNTVSGDISLEELRDIAIAARSCICEGQIGWDVGQWDDNQIGSALWNTQLLADISQGGSPPAFIGSPSINDLWYDTDTDQLKQFDGTNFVVVRNAFSVILNETKGTVLWDQSSGCGVNSTIEELAQWYTQNKWIHKTEVPNFSLAQQAAIPIIEFSPDLELNQWIFTGHSWQYRANQLVAFADSTTEPSLFELKRDLPITILGSPANIIELDPEFGDVTSYFTIGKTFTESTSTFTYTVVDSFYKISSANPDEYTTFIEVDDATGLVSGSSILEPLTTSLGDTWIGYDQQWLYISPQQTVAVNHQLLNPFIEISTSEIYTPTSTNGSPGLSYQFVSSEYAQKVIVLESSGFPANTVIELISALQERALLESNDIRVYYNGERIYSDFNLISVGSPSAEYIGSISFDFALSIYDEIIIELGATSFEDIGREDVLVRTEPSDTLFTTSELISITRYHKYDQVKQLTTQYPLFDIYQVDGDSAFKANEIFTYRESSDVAVVPEIGIRAVHDGDNFEFEQFLIDIDNGPLFAYRDYSLQKFDYWYNSHTSEIFFWTGKTWSDRTFIGDYFTKGIVSEEEPTDSTVTGLIDGLIDGLIWYDLQNEILKQYDASMNAWEPVLFHTSTSDPTIQSIWKKGLNDEKYIPAKVDDNKRTLDEYNEERDVFVESKVIELQVADPTLSDTEAQNQAILIFQAQDATHLRPDGTWSGDWEVPDPLFNNHLHENRKVLSRIELLTHFDTIINSQPIIPAFTGRPQFQFHLLDFSEVNFGLGGLIKEYNNGYDNFFSSVYINNVTVPTLIEFAQSQYENILIQLRELYRRQAVDLIIGTSTSGSQSAIIDAIITEYETNDIAGSIYHDTTTFNDTTDKGIRNWIATLPYFGLADKHVPYIVQDPKLDINEVIHHDSHRTDYKLPSITTGSLIQQIINKDDPRAPGLTYGLQSTSLPPNDLIAFDSAFGGSSNRRSGVFWYTNNISTKTLYKMIVTTFSSSQPPVSLPDDTLWMDTTPGQEVLRIKSGLNWNIVSGLVLGDKRLHNGTNPSDVTTATISAWDEIDINNLLVEIILEAEQRLYENLPNIIDMAVDYDAIFTSNPTLYSQYLEERFFNFAHEHEIVAPLSSDGIFSATDPFTWNYISSPISLYPSSANLGTEKGGDWRELYTQLYNTPYPHLEPWRLQLYKDKPDWWDATYLNTNIAIDRRWEPVMWTNILGGIIPGSPQFDFPDGVTTIPTYNYVSVNIDTISVSDDGGTTVYDPDDLLPPFWDFTNEPAYALNTPSDPFRSVYFDFNTQIVNPGADYNFGDGGFVEWQWRTSSDFLYDQFIIAYRIEPIKVLNNSFGTDLIQVNDLEIDTRTENTFAHNRVLFHGEIISGDNVYLTNGLNQWYVNYNRFSGFDRNYADFDKLWIGWNAPLSYQFNGFIDTSSFRIANDNIVITPFDHEITIKKSPGIDDAWLNSFNVSVTRFAPQITRYNNQNDWQFQVDTSSPLGESIEVYDVRLFQFYVDPSTDICTIYKYGIIGIDSVNSSFTITGDDTKVFVIGRTFTVSGTTLNDGSKTVSKVVYDPTNDTTVVYIATVVVNEPATGFITADYRILPWNSGDPIYLSSDRQLPSVFDDGFNSLLLQEGLRYFFIRLSDTTFKIARTQSDALIGTSYDILTSGQQNTYVGELLASFTANNSPFPWFHYALDTSSVRTLTPPFAVKSVQDLVNIIDGYSRKIKDAGFVVNYSKLLRDPDTGVIVDWQAEIERFINWLFDLRNTRLDISQEYSCTVNISTNVWTFTSGVPAFATGEKIQIVSDAAFPTPILKGLKYYIIRSSDTEFSLAASKLDAELGNAIDITSIAGVSGLALIPAKDIQQFPMLEINPFRNGIWFRPELGIVSDMINGPFKDVRIQHLLFDQYARALPHDKVFLFREDKITEISIRDQIRNDVEPQPIFIDPYNYLHLGGAHIFTDGYENVILLNNYTTSGDLLYDPFLGLFNPEHDVTFFKQDGVTQRPNVGGHYLIKSEGNFELRRNIEASIDDMRRYYDTFLLPETITVAEHSRALLGYDGTREYLDLLGLNPKSQFLFWKGLIQNKGSINAMNAFINSKHFIDAKLDEFWALKVAEFGSIRDKEYPELYLTINDTDHTNTKLEFLALEEDPDDADDEFVGIPLNDQARWFKQPKQELILSDDGNRMFFRMKPYNSKSVQELYDDPVNFGVINSATTNTVLIRHNFKADSIVISFRYDVGNGTESVYFVDQSKINRVSYDVVELEGILTAGPRPSIIFDVIGSPDDESIPLYDINIIGLNVDKESQNPAQLVDKIAQVVLTSLIIWDPARGHHYHIPENEVDLETDIDPAKYGTQTPEDFWSNGKVGTIWWDTSLLDYTPYYDLSLHDTIDKAIKDWGKLTDWSEIKLYQWTKSDVPPDQWDELAAQEEIDSSIPKNERKTGNIRKVLMETLVGSPSTTIEWIRYHNKFDYEYNTTVFTAGGSAPFIDEITNTFYVDFPDPTGRKVEIFINGILFKEDTLTSSGTVIVDFPFKDKDRIDILRKVPTDAEVENDTNLEYVTDYSTTTELDSFGNTVTRYFFWVSDKRVIQPNNALAMNDMVSQLTLTTAPFMVFNKPIDSTVNTSYTSYVIPDKFSQVIIHGIFGKVNNNNRYTVIFTRDFTLRDELSGSTLSYPIVNINSDDEFVVDGNRVDEFDVFTSFDVINSNIKQNNKTWTIGDRIYDPINDQTTITVFTNSGSIEPSGSPVVLGTIVRYEQQLEDKDLHSEWVLFRQEQLFNIRRDLWDRATESLAGQKLSDASIRVPSLERELYDQTYLSDTRFGLGDDQSFTDGVSGVDIVLDYLKDSNNDFSPINIESFFDNFSFDTPDNIIKAMDRIYNAFPFTHVNRIFFALLFNAFAFKSKYSEIFKTSMVALHGIKILETQGLFDD